MKELDLLYESLHNDFIMRLDGCTWMQPQLMGKELHHIRTLFNNPVESISEKSITTSLIIFRQTRNLPTFNDLKYACYGLTQQIGEWKLIEDDKLFVTLLQKISDLHSKPGSFKRCYQGLLSCYFDYNIFTSKGMKNGEQNWISLREYLLKHLPSLHKAKIIPKWVQIIHDHKNLFGEEPCKRYARALVNDDTTEFNEVCDGLLVPHNSWVRESAILARIEAECRLDDKTFQYRLTRCLEMVINNSDIKICDEFKKRCIAQLILRYTRCASKPEHEALRDAAVKVIGNPWINQLSWDTYVKDENARKMINGWLKRLLITEFFQILSEDGSADKRRLRYWLRYEPKIEDMWFALGPHARYHNGIDFKKFRDIAKDRLLWLESGGQSENNAFIMQIGQYVLVEFGTIGNAFFMFNTSRLPFNLNKKVIFGDSSNLKSKQHIVRLRHMDGKIKWEDNFDNNLSPYIGSRSYAHTYTMNESNIPKENIYEYQKKSSLTNNQVNEPRIYNTSHQNDEIPSLKGLLFFFNKLNIGVTDRRDDGGGLWIRTNNKNQTINEKLLKWGFRYREGHGWYREK